MASLKLGSKSEIFQLEGQTWTCKSELPSDVTIEIGEMTFQLHKFPLLNRSGLLQKVITEFRSEDGKGCVIQLHEIPGGAKSFELVVRFCYDVKFELNSLNVVALRCAAEHLQMTEDFGEGNLIMQTETFLDEVLGDWNDSMKALQTCKEVLPLAEELRIVPRCIDSLASKAFSDPTLLSWPMQGQANAKNLSSTVLWNGISSSGRSRSPGAADWWYKDVSFLDFPIYKRLIIAMESKGMNAETIAGSLMHYAKRYLPGLSRHSNFEDSSNRISSGASSSTQSESEQKALLEEIVELLPMEKGASLTKFLLGLLRTSMILHANPSCRENLERKVGVQLDEAALEDLLIPNLGYSAETLYDVECVQRILDHFILVNQPSVSATPVIIDDGQLMGSSAGLTPITVVAKLVDGYLAEVASDANLKFPKFQSLAALIPDYARQLDDEIYRAIDIYLKSHPWLTDSEREQLCRLMNCQKLSLEACTHAAQNERLPLRVIVQVLFFEQVRLRTTIASWFYISDDIENPNAPHRVAHKNNNGHPTQSEIAQHDAFDVEEVKLRVSELEMECSTMREEIQKLGKTRSSWSSLCKRFGFRSKSQQTSK